MKKVISNLLFVLLCVVVFFAVAFVSGRMSFYHTLAKSRAAYHVEWNDEVGTIYRNLAENKEMQTGYDLYIPTKKSSDNHYSLILYLHGGGFTSGDKTDSDAEMLCKYYAAKGYVCASVNYTLSDKTHDSNINLMYDEICEQVKSMKEEAEKLGYELTEMAATGDSAGGCLALLYAYRQPEQSPIPVKLVFEMCGPATFDPAKWGLETAALQAEFISNFSGIPVNETELDTQETVSILKQISPAMLVNENTVPTVFAYGVNDKIVPVNLKYELINSLEHAKVDYTYIEFPHSGHAMAFDPDLTKEYLDTVQEYLEKYMENVQ